MIFVSLAVGTLLHACDGKPTNPRFCFMLDGSFSNKTDHLHVIG